MAWDLAARNAARARAASHAARTTGTAAIRRAGRPARVWTRSTGLDVPATGRLPAAVLTAWEAAGSVMPIAETRTASTGGRQYEQARTVLSAICTAAVEDGYLTDHPVRMRPGNPNRRRRHSSSRIVPIVSVAVLLQVVTQMPAPYGLAALLTAFGGPRGSETFALTAGTCASGRRAWSVM